MRPLRKPQNNAMTDEIQITTIHFSLSRNELSKQQGVSQIVKRVSLKKETTEFFLGGIFYTALWHHSSRTVARVQWNENNKIKPCFERTAKNLIDHCLDHDACALRRNSICGTAVVKKSPYSLQVGSD